MKKTIYSFICVVLAAASISCSDDKDKEPVASPEAVSQSATYDALSFSWSAVSGCHQYGVEVSDEEGQKVYTAVTKQTEATVSGLEPDTKYTVGITAYAADMSATTTGTPLTVEMRTAPLTMLETPAITNETRYDWKFTWEAVEYASEYEYVLEEGGDIVQEGTVPDTEVTFANGTLPDGNYTLKVTALTKTPGYTSSRAATALFNGGLHTAYRAPGTFAYDITGATYNGTLVAMSDYTYTIESWCGVGGYNLDFAINNADTGNKFSITNDVTPTASGYYDIPTGLETPATIRLRPASNYCKLVEAAAKVTVVLSAYNSSTRKWVNCNFTGIYE